MGLRENFHLEAILSRLINEDATSAIGMIALGLEDGRAALDQLSLALGQFLDPRLSLSDLRFGLVVHGPFLAGGHLIEFCGEVRHVLLVGPDAHG